MADEEVGIRVSLKNRRETSAGLLATRREIDDLGTTADRASRRTSGLGSSFSRLRSGAGKLARGLGYVGAAVGAVAIATGVKAVNAASDLNETLSKTGQLFGKEMLPGLEKWSAATATTLGQSQQQALDAAATFAVFGKSAGLTGKELTGFSKNFTGLASDLASFHNSSPQEAIDAIGAALRGEAEPMRRFGVLLDDASMRSEALRLGLVKTTKTALTPQQKVLAAQALIYKQTKDAQGDFARTSGGLANQQRILAAQFENAKAKLGQGLLPVATRFFTWANKMFPKVQQLSGELRSRLGPIVGRVGDAFKQVAGSIQGLVARFQSGKGAAGEFSKTWESIQRFVRPLIPMFVKVGENLMAVLRPGLAEIGRIVTEQVLPAFRRFLPAVQPIAKFLLEVIGGAVVGALKGAISVVKGALRVIGGLFDFFAGLLTGDWSRMWGGLKDIAGGLLQAIWGAIQVWWNVGILALFKKGIAFLTKGLWTGLWNGLKTGASKGLSLITNGVMGGLRLIGQVFIGAIRGYLGLWKTLFTGIWNIIKLGWKVARSAFGGALAAIRTVVSSAFNAVRGTIGKAMSGAAGLVRSGVGNIVGFVKGLPGSLIKLGGSFLGAGKSLIGKFFEGLKSLVGKAGGALGDVGRTILTGIINILNVPIRAINAAIPDKISIPGAPDINLPDNPLPTIPQLAKGGPVSAGSPYIVGDRGPRHAWELFVPSSDGYVFPRVPDVDLDDFDLGGASPRRGPIHLTIPVMLPNGKVLGETVLDDFDERIARR